MTFEHQQIQAHLQQKYPDQSFELTVLDTVDSTNSFLMKQQARIEPQVCIASVQTAGRGRFGKSWQTQTNKSLCCSIRLAMQQPLDQLMGYSLVIALAIKSVLQPIANKTIQLKWPNDILVDDKKLCGILIESCSHSQARVDLVIGVGINLEAIDSDTFESISLDECEIKSHYTDNELVASLIAAIVSYSQDFQSHGFEKFQTAWLNEDRWVGSEVTVTMANGQQSSGRYSGLDNKGQIEIQMDDVTKSFNAGEISLRRKQV